MPTGSLTLRVTDTLDEPVLGPLTIDFDPVSGSAGGAPAKVEFDLSGQTDLEITNLQGLGGLGTRYEVRLSTSHFKTYAFFQVIREKTTTPATDSPIRLVVKPKQVQDIDAPPFSRLPPTLRAFLNGARMQIGPKKFETEDGELLGLAGAALYDALGPLRKACLLNLLAKSRHKSAEKCWSLFMHPVVLRQDRCFSAVHPTIADMLRASPRFVSAPHLQHKPLAGYRLVDSFKSRDSHANLQVTVMQHDGNGALAADVDIDETSGLGHGFEVIRNRVSGRTNPYLIRELLLLTGEEQGDLNPGYRFIFKR
jgi:hypothetical protein